MSVSPYDNISFNLDRRWKALETETGIKCYSDGNAVITVTYDVGSQLSEYISSAKQTYSELYDNINYEIAFEPNQLKFTVKQGKGEQTYLSGYYISGENAFSVLCGTTKGKYPDYETEFRDILSTVTTDTQSFQPE